LAADLSGSQETQVAVAADKMERLIAALGSAKVGLLNRRDAKLVTLSVENIHEALKSMDADMI
jgi:hypothetical protein